MFTFQKARLLAIFIPFVFLTSACASVTGARNSDTKNSETDSSLPTTVLSTPIHASNILGNGTDTWEKQRVNYLRSLDYQKIEHQNIPHQQYMLEANLVESRYDLKNSEIALYQDHDLRTAMLDLRDALRRYKHAVALANQKELNRLGLTEQHLESLIKNTDKNMRCSCENPDPGRYHNIETSIETLLARL